MLKILTPFQVQQSGGLRWSLWSLLPFASPLQLWNMKWQSSWYATTNWLRQIPSRSNGQHKWGVGSAHNSGFPLPRIARRNVMFGQLFHLFVERAPFLLFFHLQEESRSTLVLGELQKANPTPYWYNYKVIVILLPLNVAYYRYSGCIHTVITTMVIKLWAMTWCAR